MSETTNLVGKQYQQLYSGYYSDAGDTFLKRQLSAMQTLGYVSRALAGCTFERLLDVGAGDGNVLAQLDGTALARELHAVEISESGVAAIESRRLSTLRAVHVFDGYHIPYPDKYFDLAIAVHVLEHVEHERMFLREIARVARNAYIEVPLEHGLRIQRSIESGKRFGHINFYTRDTLRSLLESAGLQVHECRTVASSLQYEQHLSGRFKGRLKSLVRNGALALWPRLAPWFIVYNGYAYCECK